MSPWNSLQIGSEWTWEEYSVPADKPGLELWGQVVRFEGSR
jgi:hypothetical protein